MPLGRVFGKLPEQAKGEQVNAAEEAYAKAVELIELAKTQGADQIWFETEDFFALEVIPEQIADLPALRQLYFHKTSVRELTPLSGLTGLDALTLNQSNVSDLTPLSGMTWLSELSLNQTPVSDLAPLSGLTGLVRLSLNQTSVSDLAPLRGLPGLTGLYLNQTSVSDLAPLSSLTGLGVLELNQTFVDDLSPLSGLTELWALSLDQTAVSDLVPLSRAVELGILSVSQTPVRDLTPLRGLTGLKQLYLNQTSVSDLAPISALTGLRVLRLDETEVRDLRPLMGLSKLADAPTRYYFGLTLKNCTACEIDPEIAEISEIEDDRERAARLFDYLKDWVPPETVAPKSTRGATVFDAANELETQFKRIGGLRPPQPMEPDRVPGADARRASHAPLQAPISVGQIQQVMRDSYPDLQDRAARLVALVQQERAAHAMILRPNDPEALRSYEEKEEFLKTMEAGLVSIHEDLPDAAPEVIPEEKAKALRDKLTHLAGLLDSTIRYLDEDKGTYGGLYKIGLISGVASLLALIPGVTFVTGAALPSLVLGVQTFRVVVGRDDKG